MLPTPQQVTAVWSSLPINVGEEILSDLRKGFITETKGWLDGSWEVRSWSFNKKVTKDGEEVCNVKATLI